MMPSTNKNTNEEKSSKIPDLSFIGSIPKAKPMKSMPTTAVNGNNIDLSKLEIPTKNERINMPAMPNVSFDMPITNAVISKNRELFNYIEDETLNEKITRNFKEAQVLKDFSQNHDKSQKVKDLFNKMSKEEQNELIDVIYNLF